MYLKHQLNKVKAHYLALKEYYNYINDSKFDFAISSFEKLQVQDRGVLEAYLKRFASLQDYLGAKVFKGLLDISGISYSKMSEVLILMEKEEIIDLDQWIAFRNIRNNLEHDYPDELQDALKYFIDSFKEIEKVIIRVFEFAGRYDESIKLP